jgi:hypothetical protein
MSFGRVASLFPAVFSAGHLCELTWQVPFELGDAVLVETPPIRRGFSSAGRGNPARGSACAVKWL